MYIELVHKISPAYYVRHKVAQCHESNGVFLMAQQFLDPELVISIIGCQKLDVIALEAGKAIDHLQLVMLLKTLLESRLRAPIASACTKLEGQDLPP